MGAGAIHCRGDIAIMTKDPKAIGVTVSARPSVYLQSASSKLPAMPVPVPLDVMQGEKVGMVFAAAGATTPITHQNFDTKALTMAFLSQAVHFWVSLCPSLRNLVSGFRILPGPVPMIAGNAETACVIRAPRVASGSPLHGHGK